MAIEDLDFYGWSWAGFTETYICFTEDFDANTEISTTCGDGEDGNDSDDNSFAVILGVVGAVLVVGIVVVFAYFWKRRKPAKPQTAAAPPVAAVVHEPTAPPLAPIKAEALEMMAEETAEFAPEAASLPPGHVSGAQAAAMARRVTVVRTETMTGRETFGEIVAVQPAPPPTGAYSPEPEC